MDKAMTEMRVQGLPGAATSANIGVVKSLALWRCSFSRTPGLWGARNRAPIGLFRARCQGDTAVQRLP